VPVDLLRRAAAQFQKQRRNEEQRVKTFGQVRPIMHTHVWEKQLVVVRGKIYEAPEKSTFTNFLFYHGLFLLGEEWVAEQENLRQEERHPLYLLHRQAMDFVNQQPLQPEGYVTVKPNAALSFCERFYYDLYTVDDNNALQEELLHRLRNHEQFQGARHELFVEATCLRAGFTIMRQVYTGPKPKNPEFIAVHKATQQHIAVEAKSKHRPGVMGWPGIQAARPDTRFGGLINNAAAKDPRNPMALFVDTNLPPDRADAFYRSRCGDPTIMSEPMLRLARLVQAHHRGVDPYNLLVYSNFPQRYGDGYPGVQDQWGTLRSNRPRVPLVHEAALNDLVRAIDLFGNIPTDFPKLVPGSNIPA